MICLEMVKDVLTKATSSLMLRKLTKFKQSLVDIVNIYSSGIPESTKKGLRNEKVVK